MRPTNESSRAAPPSQLPTGSFADRILPLFGGLVPLRRESAVRDGPAGFTLAAMNVPQSLGYARIAGMPVVTGLYTLLLPLVAFATFGSSRYLVVAADSATAAILADGLSPLAPLASPHYVELAGAVALLTAACLLVARLFRLGFLADFLSQTVLVGFLTGVGFQVGIAVLGEMLGLEIHSGRSLPQLLAVVAGVRQAHPLTMEISAAAVAVVFLCRVLAPRLPGPLLAVAGAIAASMSLDFAARGVTVVGPVAGGLPHLQLPQVTLGEIQAILPIAGSCFLVIVAQSAATARAYATRHREALDENADLVGLSAANVAAALSGTFTVNGSPTQTAMVESAGGRSQVAQLATAAVVALLLLFLTSPLQYLPRCILGAIVFTIAVGLIDVRGLRAILRESPGEFRLALLTAGVVVGVGVEEGVLVAMLLSLLRHVRHSYRPHTAVLVEAGSGLWKSVPAQPGTISAPGVVVFQFGADLFYANAGRFAEDVRRLAAADEVRWLVVDAGAITSIDYSAARVLLALYEELQARGVVLVLVHPQSSLQADLDRHHLSEVIGREYVFDALHEALAMIRRVDGGASGGRSREGSLQHEGTKDTKV